MKRINFSQGSEDWLNWRREGVGASDYPAIVDESPYLTPYKLWAIKTSRLKEDSPNRAMTMGTELEPLIREKLGSEIGVFHPVCAEDESDPILRASLDGLSEDEKTAIEIKYNNKANHKLASQGKVVDHHYLQVQYQLLVSGAKKNVYVSYNDKDGGIKVVDVEPNKRLQNEMKRKTLDFWQSHIIEDIPPTLSDSDYLVGSEDWKEKAALASELMAKIEADKKRLDEIKKELIEMSDHSKMMGSGVLLYKSERKGSVDYSKLCKYLNVKDELKEEFRKKSSSSWTLKRGAS